MSAAFFSANSQETAASLQRLTRAEIGEVDAARPKSRRGFASMTPEQRKRIASLGGKAVSPEKRSFSVDRALASDAGRHGAQAAKSVPKKPAAGPVGFAAMPPDRQKEIASRGGKAVPAEKRTFSYRPTVTHAITTTAEGRRLWDIHKKMVRRCSDPNDAGFKNYGGRGIVVCARWAESVEMFVVDMGPRPSPEHSIDRIDNDGPYSPENCRWATQSQQSRNRRNTVFVIHDGAKRPIADVADELGMWSTTLRRRIQRGAMPGMSLWERQK